MVGLGAILALCLAVPSADSGPVQTDQTHRSDSTGAVIDLQRSGDTLQIRALFLGEDRESDTLFYDLSVRRSGSDGTTQTTQSGSFSATSPRPDTLSTVQVNVQAGDHIRLRLSVRAREKQIDATRIECTIS